MGESAQPHSGRGSVRHKMSLGKPQLLKSIWTLKLDKSKLFLLTFQKCLQQTELLAPNQSLLQLPDHMGCLTEPVFAGIIIIITAHLPSFQRRKTTNNSTYKISLMNIVMKSYNTQNNILYHCVFQYLLLAIQRFLEINYSIFKNSLVMGNIIGMGE